MTDQPRVAKVLAALLSSMTVGAAVLLLLDGRPVPAGPFSLSSYSRLDSVSHTIGPAANLRDGNWRSVEIFYSHTNGGDLEQVAALTDLPAEDLNFHFLVCNGRGGGDGKILPTEKWRRQWPSVPGGGWYGNSFTLRICIVGDDPMSPPTESQIRRTGQLVESLLRRFDITPDNVNYPAGWQF